MRRVWEEIGQVSVRSGRLVALDFGCLWRWRPDWVEGRSTGSFRFDEMDASLICGVPTGTWPVRGRRVRRPGCHDGWAEVVVQIRDAPPIYEREAGGIWVDSARMMFADPIALPRWVHEESLDGRADVALWGGDGAAVAAKVGAQALPEGAFGWTDLPLAEARRRARALDALRSSLRYRFAWDLRPHSHHFQLLAQIRATTTESGVLSLGGDDVCGLMTSWGDGYFPVLARFDAAGALQSVAAQLCTEANLV